MTIKLELFGQLRLNRAKTQNLEIGTIATVSEVAKMVEVLPEQIGMAAIDGTVVQLDEPVPDNCRLSLFPPMMGG